MTIPNLITTEVAGQNIASLVETLNGLINPNRRFNQQLQQMFLQKPELMQKFVDIEKANPGTLEAFGFNEGAMDLLTGLQESIPGIKNRVLGPEVAKALTTPGPTRATAVQQAATGQTPGQFSADQVIKLLQDEVFINATDEQKAEFVSRFLTGEDTLDNLLDEIRKKDLETAKDFESRSPLELAQLTLNGGASIGQISGSIESPGRTKAYTAALTSLLQQARQDEANFRANLRISNRLGLEDFAQRGAVSDIFRRRTAAAGIGTIAAWAHALHPNNKEITSLFGPASKAEIGKVNKVIQSQRNQQAIREQQTFATSFYRALDELQDNINKDERRPAFLSNVNELLRAHGAPWTAEIKDRGILGIPGFLPSPRIIFTSTINPDDETTDASAVAAGIQPDPLMQPDVVENQELLQAIDQEVSILRGMRPELARLRLNNLTAQNPALGAQVESIFLGNR